MTKNDLTKILRAGGATLSASGEAVEYSRGYQVSVCDLLIIDTNREAEAVAFINSQPLAKGECLGLWVDAGKLYIDKSKHYNSKAEAIKQGNATNQISIFNWSNKTCIYLKK